MSGIGAYESGEKWKLERVCDDLLTDVCERLPLRLFTRFMVFCVVANDVVAVVFFAETVY